MTHYDPEVLALLALGESDAATDGAEHLRTCAECRAEVDSLSSVVSTARSITFADAPMMPGSHVWDRIAAEVKGGSRGVHSDAATPAGSSVVAMGSRRRGWLPLAVAALIGAVVGSGAMYAGTNLNRDPIDSGNYLMKAALNPIDDPTATGTAVVSAASQGRMLTVRTQGLPLKPGSFYEVWLFDPKTNGMVAVGVLSSDGRGAYPVPPGLDMGTYNSVDVSLQPMNGSTDHSSTSAVRGTFST